MGKTQFIITVLSLLVVLSAGIVSASEGVWMTDFKKATELAQKENKDLLVNFTGSDWCHWCKQLKAEVFGKEKFVEEARTKFILVEIDFPDQIEQSEELIEQNDALSVTYEIEGYPTIMLLDSLGRAYAKTGYMEGGAQNYLEHLSTLQTVKAKRDMLFDKAEMLSGKEHAEVLDMALTLMAENGIDFGYSDVIEKILSIDEEINCGFKEKYKSFYLKQEVKKILFSAEKTKDYKKASEQFDQLIQSAAIDPEIAQRFYLVEVKYLIDYSERDDLIKASLQRAYDAAPDSEQAEEILFYLTMLSEK